MKLAYVAAGMTIPELELFGRPLYRGGLEDLSCHVIKGLAERGITVIPITYGYPIDWKTAKCVDYYDSPARFLFNLTVDIHFDKRTVPVFGIHRAGVLVYLINDPLAGVLYPADKGEKLKQSAFLGRAAAALLKKIGVRPSIVWAQEYLAASTLFPTMQDDPFFSETRYVATIHTPSRGALDVFPEAWFDGLCIDRKYWNDYVTDGLIDPTLGSLRRADKATAVSKEHGETSSAMYPGIHFVGIMNGVDRDAFLSSSLRGLDNPTSQQLHAAHEQDRMHWIDLIRHKKNREIDKGRPIIGLVRRLDGYKNQLPMFKECIAAICADRDDVVGGSRGLGANVVIGGVAHENNELCRRWMSEFKEWENDPQLKGRFFYIDDYDAHLRWKAASGSDIWVACPLPFMEACGTSDFIAKINGNPNVATWSGGIKEHGTEFNPITGRGGTLFIEPYTPEKMFSQLSRACDWFYQYQMSGDGPWATLRMNNFRGGFALDVSRMIEQYDELVFQPLITGSRLSISGLRLVGAVA